MGSYCVLLMLGKHTWVIPLKYKKGVTIVKMLDDSKRKPNKTWVDEGSESCNRSMKSSLEKHNIEMYSTHNDGKSVVSEGFIKTLKSKIYKNMTVVSKNVYIENLCDIINKCNNTYHKKY